MGSPCHNRAAINPTVLLPELERPLSRSDQRTTPRGGGADRLTGRLHPPLPGGRDPIRLSLAPDARRLALQVADRGQWRVEVLDLSDLLEPDRAAGTNLQTAPLGAGE